MRMETVRVAYRDDDRTPVIYCIREMGLKHYGVNVEVLKIKDYGEFEAALFSDSADVLIDHVEFLYAEAAKGKKITFFCAPRILRGLDLVVPKHVEGVNEFAGKAMAVRDSGRPYAVTLWLRMVGLEGKVLVEFVIDTTGRVESGSMKMIESTYPAFEVEARRVLAGSTFHPAHLSRVPVRQLTRQGIRFVAAH